MVRLANGLKIRPTRPRPRGVKRLITSALPTCASATTRSSTSRSWLFSALAIADSRHFRTSREMRLRENSRSASAVATFLPRINCATRLSFCGLTRSMRATALASVSERLRSRFFLLIALASRLSGRRCGSRRCRGRSRAGGALGLAVGRMAVEHAGRRELAELVADHLLGDHYRNVLLPVVDAKGQADELRQDGRAPAPDSDHFVPPGCARDLRLLQQIAIDERTLPNRTCHDARLFLLPRVAACQDELGGGLVATGLLALGGEAPRRHRMAAARGSPLAAAVRMIDRVHRDTAVMRHAAHPTRAAGLA